MRTRKVFVWTLDILYPYGSDVPGWTPVSWDQPYTFHWPRNRNFLSEKGAHDRACMFEEYGAKVKIKKSEAVVWSDNLQKEL